MNVSELRKKSHEELGALIRELALRRESLELLLTQKKLKNVKELRVVKKDIARAHTILRESHTPQ